MSDAKNTEQHTDCLLYTSGIDVNLENRYPLISWVPRTRATRYDTPLKTPMTSGSTVRCLFDDD